MKAIHKINPLAPAGYLVACKGIPLKLPNDKAFAYVLAANGLFKWARTRHFNTIIQLYGWDRRHVLPGLDRLRFALTLQFDHLPGRLLKACIQHARRNIHKETLYQFHIKGSTVRVAMPAQKGTAGRLKFAADEYEPGAVILDLHSHHKMSAAFSATDDADEGGLRLYGVIGRLDQLPCDINLRVGVYGDFHPLPAHLLFDSPLNVMDRCMRDPR